MFDIFISYAHEDRQRAQQLGKALGALGWVVWWDRTIPAGKKYAEVIEDALANTRCMLVLWSEVSIKSTWVREEAESGLKRQILIPILISSVDQPMGFRSTQAANLIEWKGSTSDFSFLKLVEDMSNILGKPPRPVPPDPNQERPDPIWIKYIRAFKKLAATKMLPLGLVVLFVVSGILITFFYQSRDRVPTLKEPQTQSIPIIEPDTNAQNYNKAVELYNAKQYEQAYHLFLKAADQGYAAAQLYLGSMYKKGEGVLLNEKEAMSWYRKAAEQGNADAQNNLGNMYANEKGAFQNYKEALNSYRKAAEQGKCRCPEQSRQYICKWKRSSSKL